MKPRSATSRLILEPFVRTEVTFQRQSDKRVEVAKQLGIRKESNGEKETISRRLTSRSVYLLVTLFWYFVTRAEVVSSHAHALAPEAVAHSIR